MIEIGREWLLKQIDEIVESIERLTPTKFNEGNRYLPSSVTSIPGFLSYKVNPFMIEIIDCFDVDSQVREMNLMKGVQITYTTLLESIMLYYMAHVKSLPMMYMTADKELASARIENNIIPMLNHSGFADIIRSSDDGNKHKTGKTAHHLQWMGGGYMVPFGAKNADKMRTFSICIMLKDEIDAWLDRVGKDGDPDLLSDHRCRGYWERRKIARGSTPLLEETSKIFRQYKRGDQRKYNVLCKSCGFAQDLRWEAINKDSGVIGGMQWETEGGMLQLDSVCYCCSNCGHAHYEYDKRNLFSPDHGAHWKPTSVAVEPNIRSYHLPALYSPIGMAPWYTCVSAYLDGWDVKKKRVKNLEKYQGFYNNILARPFRMPGDNVEFESVSRHRRRDYMFGQIPNKYAAEYSGSPILLLTCTVDVHKSNLAVAVMGWTSGMCCYLIDYWRFEDDDCSQPSSPVWQRLRKLIEETTYTADDSKRYSIAMTFIDAGWKQSTVTAFCGQYRNSVFPSIGSPDTGKVKSIQQFSEFTAKDGMKGYTIKVDHYKDRLAPVLRRQWIEDSGDQDDWHFNAPLDVTDDQLKELTVEVQRKETNQWGVVSYRWHRPGGADNELWDLFVYGSAAVEVLAWALCIEHLEMESIDWRTFWKFLEERKVYFSD